ncbi:MAG: ABC transporter permease [Propionibacteriaceae bacterium]|nr:ABC transporter permease [Propionibacteriaceae bacterium]
MSLPEATTVQTTNLTPPKGGKRKLPTKGALIAMIWLGLLVIGVVLAIALPGADPYSNNYDSLGLPPSLSHPLGTDALGRDVLVRTLYGARSSLIIALMAVLVGGLIGTLLGTAAGYLRGWLDTVLGFVIDVLLALPSLLLVITIVALRGPSLMTISLVIALLSIPTFARISRAAALSISGESFVVAARTLGASHSTIVVREILPNVLPVITPYALTSAANAIILEGALSFLGYGLRPPLPSWGGLIADGRSQLSDAPWVTMGPALVLCLTIMAINIIGDYLSGRRRNQ